CKMFRQFGLCFLSNKILLKQNFPSADLLFNIKLIMTAMTNKMSEILKITVYPVNFSIRVMIIPDNIGPTIPANDVSKQRKPLKKSRVSGSVISNVNTLKANQ